MAILADLTGYRPSVRVCRKRHHALRLGGLISAYAYSVDDSFNHRTRMTLIKRILTDFILLSVSIIQIRVISVLFNS